MTYQAILENQAGLTEEIIFWSTATRFCELLKALKEVRGDKFKGYSAVEILPYCPF